MLRQTVNKSKGNFLNYSVFQFVSEINAKAWNQVVQEKNIYATLPYLLAMEKSLGNELGFRYLLFFDTDQSPVAIAVIQCLNFIDKGLEDKQEVCRIRNKIKKKLLTKNGINMMTCGTPFASGENGFIFSDLISSEAAYENLANALNKLQKSENKSIDSPVILFKELFPKSFSSGIGLSKNGFHEFFVDVNMILKVSSKWKNREDYLNSMVTKFRTKAKTALKKSDPLLVLDLDKTQIKFHQDSIQNLYLQVLEKSSFQFGTLKKDSFLYLKENLKEKFILKGYFLNEQLIGFSSSFIFNEILDANYVGINYSLNQEYALYQRMLYDYVELAIEKNCKELRFGRTAEEIKSSIGARPVPMKLFIKHRNPIANRILKTIVGTITPSDYELRKPFKQEFMLSELANDSTH
ncbi:MAG: hypothetical protein KBF93_16285 [Leptospiraceae bacterium]|nr:hypothetical protein [Leptospiraceae bacterium]